MFVDARLAEIRGSSLIESWHYVPTALNPSDVGTRVIYLKNKEKFLPWVLGPEFLLAENYEFPVQPCLKDEIKESIVSLFSIDDVKIEGAVDCTSPYEKFVSFIHHYSDFDRLIRSMCYVFRVVKASLLKSKKERKRFLNLSVSPLTVKERYEVEIFIIKTIQKEYFGELYEFIRSLKGEICFKVNKKLKVAFRPLRKLSVFCDPDGLIRSHSRIVNADVSFDLRFPIILPRKHDFVELLVRKVHCESGHFGWSFVLARLQQ